MAKLLKLRRGTTSQHGSFTGAEGEVTVDTDKETVVIHDGSTAGGHPVAAEDMANVSSSAIAGRLSNDSLATSKLAAGALPSDVTVASANIVDGTIVAGDIGTDQINNTHIADDAVQRPMIADNAVNGSKIADSSITSAKILDGTILNADISGSAAIGLSKLATGALPSGITVASANIVDGTIATADIADGAVSNGKITDGAINNAKVNATAAIAGTKISPDFGSQNVVTTGTLGSGDITITDNSPQINFTDGDGNPDYRIRLNTGILSFTDTTNSADRIVINSDGHLDIAGNTDFGAGIDVTGNITCTGSVDGRDVAADGTKLDGIEAGATGDQTNTEIRALVNSAVDCNVFTNALLNKLNGIETSATADQTGAEILALINSSDIYTTGAIGRDNGDKLYFTDNTQLDIHINGSNEFRFEADGDFHADGDVYAFSTTVASDENLKKDIVTVTDAITKVEALKGVTFKWNKNDADSAGVIAQDVEKVLPQVVKTVADIDGNNYKAVNYSGLTSILIEAIKDLSARVKVLEAK